MDCRAERPRPACAADVDRQRSGLIVALADVGTFRSSRRLGTGDTTRRGTDECSCEAWIKVFEAALPGIQKPAERVLPELRGVCLAWFDSVYGIAWNTKFVKAKEALRRFGISSIRNGAADSRSTRSAACHSTCFHSNRAHRKRSARSAAFSPIGRSSRMGHLLLAARSPPGIGNAWQGAKRGVNRLTSWGG